MPLLPTIDEIGSLPHRARLAYAARCAARVFPLITAGRWANRKCIELATRAIRLTEDAAAGRLPYAPWDIVLELNKLAFAIPPRYSIIDPLNTTDTVRNVLFTAARCASVSIDADDAEMSAGFVQGVQNAARDALWTWAREDQWVSLRRDFDFLRLRSQKNRWNHDTPVSQSIYLLHSEFIESMRGSGYESLISAARTILDRVEVLRKAHPRVAGSLFEKLVADVCAELGWTVELTAPSNDGGRDIIAIQHGPTYAKYLIECKFWQRRVGVQIVRALHGVLEDEGATKAILVTTQGVTGPARDYVERHRWRLEVRDLEGLLRWLEDAQRVQHASALEVDVERYLAFPWH